MRDQGFLQEPLDGTHNSLGKSNTFAQSTAKNAKSTLNATVMLPWLEKPSDLEKRTLKIEVTFKGELILLRIIHIDKLYPV